VSSPPYMPSPRFSDALAAMLTPVLRELFASERDAIAERVVELLRKSDEDPRMLTPAEAGRRLGRSAEWVRYHRDELGAVPLGDGPRPRLGVPSKRVASYLACSSGRRTEEPENGAGKPSRRRRKARANGQGDEFLPIARQWAGRRVPAH
jgi:hypothetical protein